MFGDNGNQNFEFDSTRNRRIAVSPFNAQSSTSNDTRNNEQGVTKNAGGIPTPALSSRHSSDVAAIICVAIFVLLGWSLLHWS